MEKEINRQLIPFLSCFFKHGTICDLLLLKVIEIEKLSHNSNTNDDG